MNSVALAVMLLIVIIGLSQNKKKVAFKKPPLEETDKERLSLTETLYKENAENADDRFVYKKYNKKQPYKKSKRKIGPNVIQLSELLRPKSSKGFPLFPNVHNEVIPFSQTTYYKI